ncbi:hypothetical protein CCYA_CCYA04G1295 [Cyanidiococcus yangmingshanensis]|nr:hypothetical protein CCYA_CCYA04G1295 [Cyanidiococcus yangmingshanensis]
MSAAELKISDVWKALAEGYKSRVPPELRLLDLYVILLGVILSLIAVYAALVGTYPFNALLAAGFCIVGSAILTVGLRVQLDARSRVDKRNRWEQNTLEYAYVGWLLCHLVLFLTATNFMG